MLSASVSRRAPLATRQASARVVDFEHRGDDYYSRILRLKVPKTGRLTDLETSVSAQHSGAVSFQTLDGARISKNEELHHLRHMPFQMSVGEKLFTLNLSQRFSIQHSYLEQNRFEPTEEALEVYCRSIGIPKYNSEILSRFINRCHESLTSDSVTKDDIERTIFDTLSYYRTFGKNRFATNRSVELRKLHDEKLAQLTQLHEIKSKLDRKAYRRINATLALGAGIMLAQFGFITVGTYAYYCWDVMEPMAYLMMLGNTTIAFAYYTAKGRELEQSSLQEAWFKSVSERIYSKADFDGELYDQVEKDVKELRELIKQTV